MWRAFWAQVQAFAAQNGLNLPDLTPPEEVPQPWTDHWLREDLALSMTCGLPFRTALKGRVTYVGTFGFGLKAPIGHYYSRILCSVAHYENRRRFSGNAPDCILAYNGPDSQSGWAVTQHATPFVAALRFTGFLRTGSHAASFEAVVEGRADVAYVDAVTLRILKRCGYEMSAVRLLGRSVTSPGLPLICALGLDPEPLRRALRDATLAFEPDGDPYLMGGPLGFHVLDPEDYYGQPIPAPPPV